MFRNLLAQPALASALSPRRLRPFQKLRCAQVLLTREGALNKRRPKEKMKYFTPCHHGDTVCHAINIWKDVLSPPRGPAAKMKQANEESRFRVPGLPRRDWNLVPPWRDGCWNFRRLVQQGTRLVHLYILKTPIMNPESRPHLATRAFLVRELNSAGLGKPIQDQNSSQRPASRSPSPNRT